MPALVGLVLVSGPLVAWVGPGDPTDTLGGAVVVLTQLTSFFHVSGNFPVQAWLPTWSLTVEWVFYLSWPLALMGMQKRGFCKTQAMRAALVLAALLYIASVPLSPDAFYYLPVGNLAVMLMGAALALAHAREPQRTSGRDAGVADLAFLAFVLAVLVPTTGLSGTWLYRVTYVPVAVIVALVLIDQRPGTGDSHADSLSHALWPGWGGRVTASTSGTCPSSGSHIGDCPTCLSAHGWPSLSSPSFQSSGPVTFSSRSRFSKHQLRANRQSQQRRRAVALTTAKGRVCRERELPAYPAFVVCLGLGSEAQAVAERVQLAGAVRLGDRDGQLAGRVHLAEHHAHQ